MEEFADRIGQTVHLSATPGPYELSQTGGEFVEQVIRPTGLVDPQVVVKPTKGQIDDLIGEIRKRPTATSGCWSPRSPRRWPRTSPTICWSWASGAVSALGGRHAAPWSCCAAAAR